MRIWHHPEVGVCADVIPHWRSDGWHLFCLRDFRDPAVHGTGTPWYHLRSPDGLEVEDLGEALPRGDEAGQDRWIFTGCVIEDRGRHWIYYTGHNHLPAWTGNREVILRAWSNDLRTWHKDTGFALPALPGYDRHDWRDPFIFRNEEAGEWQMLLAARHVDGPERRSGLTARLGSADLDIWHERTPIYDPGLYFTHECPDLFRMGSWWYLVFSEYSHRTVTRYRMARGPEGPWMTPADDALDTRAWYAAKTASDGCQRLAFGWIATREGGHDGGAWQWGGTMVAHALRQRADGTLAVGMPTALVQRLGAGSPAVLRRVSGSWTRVDGQGAIISAADERSVALGGETPEAGGISCRCSWDARTRAFGLVLRASGAGDSCIEVRIDPGARLATVDAFAGHHHSKPVVERRIDLPEAGTMHLRCVVDGTCLIAYLGADAVMSARVYAPTGGWWGAFAEGPGLVVAEATIHQV